MNTISSNMRIPAGFEPFQLPGKETTEKTQESFGATLSRSLNDVNDLLQMSDQKAQEVAIGKSENLHDAMIGFEKAETAFKLLVQVRNRALDAYHEIMRMQV